MQGYLTKPNKSFGSKKRFFVLDQSVLSYYETEARGEKLAEIFLNADTRVSAVDDKQITIVNVAVGTKSSTKTSYVLMCNVVPQQRDQWVAALQNACKPPPSNTDGERLKKEAEEAERLRLLREAEAAERLRLQLEQARIEAERREADERARQQAEEADRLRRQLEQARVDSQRREAEELARRQAEEQQRANAAPAPVVFDIPEPELVLKPREETPVFINHNAVFKVGVA